MHKIFLPLAFLIAFALCLNAQEKKEYKIGTIAFYNLENLFDQMIFSPAFVSSDKSTYVHYASHVFNKAFLTQKEGRYKGYPLRTYATTII